MVAARRSSSPSPGSAPAEHLGRLLRTVFLCDYIAIEDFRREIHTLLNRGESVHQLQRAVFTGKLGACRAWASIARIGPSEDSSCRI